MNTVNPAELIVDIRETVVESMGRPGRHSWIGWEVETDRQTIQVMITNEQDCCEVFGYFATNDRVTDYIGAMLTGIALVDDRLDVTYIGPEELRAWEYDDPDERGTCTFFVNFETDRGVFQLAVYNNHNGYYGHKVRLTSTQLSKEETR